LDGCVRWYFRFRYRRITVKLKISPALISSEFPVFIEFKEADRGAAGLLLAARPTILPASVNNAVFHELFLCLLKIFLEIVIQIFGNPEILFIPLNQKFDTDCAVFSPSSARRSVNG
jgi:hypothetical protein